MDYEKTKLTPVQQAFAEQHHHLVYEFMRKQKLNADVFYDRIVFGYLRAVIRYANEPTLWQYPFQKIANKCMFTEYINYLKGRGRQKRAAECSLEAFSHKNIPDARPYARELEMNLLLHSLAAQVTPEQMRLIRLRMAGISDREIAKSERRPVHSIQQTLDAIRTTVVLVCSEFEEGLL